MKIKVNTDSLNSKYEEINDSLDDYTNAVIAIRNITDEIGSSWEGEGYNTFNSKMQELINDLNKLESSLEDFNKFLNAYISGIKKIDNEFSKVKIRLK